MNRQTAALALIVGLLAVDARAARRSLCDLAYPSDARIDWTCRTIGKEETLEGLFGDRWIDVARFNRIDRRHVVRGLRIKVPGRLEAIERFTPMPMQYAPADTDSQFVLVDLSEQFLGAYEKGRLVFSAPIAAGTPRHRTPPGMFRITAYDRDHVSSIYDIGDTGRPYPMHYGLRFHITASGMSYWIHGRDMPGVPVSHGCIGLYDEAMQRRHYGRPDVPVLVDARRLFEWVVGSRASTGMHALPDGPRVRIVTSAAEREARLVTRAAQGLVHP
jgi:L,D-transpeptidase-like protein